ncbi:group I truncated hemoglobin [Zavarzinia sp. CC-PAN008]|uniref:group I truncated hemoglobin n=1 Tax=Zavarzinia sp. CC-PAN008 TaxID=3243332 RepID=UPI003F747C66
MVQHRLSHASLVLLLALAACGGHDAVPPPADLTAPAPVTATAAPAATASLYDRLGGTPAIAAVVDLFIANVAADPVINQDFAKTDIPRLKRLLVEQLCEASGGPCRYSGKDMLSAHKGQNVTQAEFEAMGADMARALDTAGVPAREKGEVLTLLGSMQRDIVGH